MDSFVERSDVTVLRVRANMSGGGPADAMRVLESKLPSLKGRKFYGVFRLLEAGEEYFACVEQIDSDDPERMGLETGTIPGGLYARRKLYDWQKIVDAGKLPEVGREFVRGYDIDRSRPEIEYYRSMSEMHLLLPVLSRSVPPPAVGWDELKVPWRRRTSCRRGLCEWGVAHLSRATGFTVIWLLAEGQVWKSNGTGPDTAFSENYRVKRLLPRTRPEGCTNRARRQAGHS